MSIKDNFPNLRPSMLMDFANTKQLDSRVTFARASEGRYYDGKSVAKAEENLLTYSQEFDQWVSANLSTTANATTAPDGTTTSDLLVPTGNNAYVTNGNVLVETNSTWSVYAKSNGNNFIYIYTQTSGARLTYFDLSTGAVGTSDSSHTASIEDVFGDGSWYRCIVTSTLVGNRFNIGVTDADGSTSATNLGGVYLWGAQLEQRSSVTAYTPTTTQPITNYIPVLQTAASNVARFDHDPVTGESLGLLVEEQRTNLLTYSEQFDNAGWTKLNATIAANTVIAPDGTLTGDKLIEDTSTQSHYLTNSIVPTASTNYTATAYIKAAERGFAFFGLNGGGSIDFASINLSTGATAVVTGSLVSHSATNVGNGWWRVSITKLTSSTATLFLDIRTSENGVWANRAYTGDGYSGIYIWGAQLEAGAFPTSYIPTSASQVTRSADAASMTGTNFSEWYRADEGGFYTEAKSDEVGSRRIFAVSDGTYSQRFSSYFGTASHFRGQNTASGFTLDLDAGTQSANVFGKVAVSYAIGAQAVSLNGDTVVSATNTRSMPLVDRLFIGADATGASILSGHIKKLAYYPQRLSNSNLQALTS